MRYLNRRVVISKRRESQFNGYRGLVIKENKKRLTVSLENTCPRRITWVSKKECKLIPSKIVILRKAYNRMFYAERKTSTL